jgi:hypothetical protein
MDNQNVQIFRPSSLARLAGCGFGILLLIIVAYYTYYVGASDILVQIALVIIGLWMFTNYGLSNAKVDDEGFTIQKMFFKWRFSYSEINHVLYEEFGISKRRKTIYLTFFKKDGKRQKTEWEFTDLKTFFEILDMHNVVVRKKYDTEEEDPPADNNII